MVVESVVPIPIWWEILYHPHPTFRQSDQLGLEKDRRSNFKADYGQYATNLPAVFAAAANASSSGPSTKAAKPPANATDI